MKSDGACPNDVKKIGYIFDTLRAGLAEPPAEEMHRHIAAGEQPVPIAAQEKRSPCASHEKHVPMSAQETRSPSAAEEKNIPIMITLAPTEEGMTGFPSVQSMTDDEEESLVVRTRKRRGSSMIRDVVDIAPKEIGARSIEQGSSDRFADSSNSSESDFVDSSPIKPMDSYTTKQKSQTPPIEQEEIVVTSTFMEPIAASPGNEFFKASPPPDDVSDMSAPEPTKSRQTKPTGGKKAANTGSKPSVKSESSKGDVYVPLSFDFLTFPHLFGG